MRSLTLERGDDTLVGAEQGEGPAALLLHAGGERAAVWRQIGETLARHSFRSVAYDLRGHGESSPQGAELLQTHADDVVAMLACEIVPPLLVGASLGGLAAILACARTGVRRQISGVVLVDVVPNMTASRVRSYLSELGYGLADRPIVDDVLGRIDELCATTRELTDVPTLLVRGGRSPMTNADVAGFLHLAPDAGVELVEGAGHLVAQDSPSELATLLLAQLEADAIRRLRIDSLLERGAAATDHPGGMLLEHLDRTADTLAAWGAPAFLVDAGRLHAAYGTDGFPHPMPGVTPEAIVAAAGKRAERLVDLYGNCDRAKSYPTFLSPTPVVTDRRNGERRALSDGELRAFVELTVANELDVLANACDSHPANTTKLAAVLATWTRHLSQPARRALRSLDLARDSAQVP